MKLIQEEEHPMDELLRSDRIPHIWCPGCGLGSVMTCFIEAIDRIGIDPQKLSVVSGIGCTGRVAGYIKTDSFHTTHGRAIPFATGLKLGNPDLHVVVFSGDGDLFAIGGNHFIHAARRNIDMTVICVNNFNYGMTGGQMGPTTPIGAKLTTAPFGSFEYPFNLPYVAAASGATYVARWTSLHVRRLIESIEEAMVKPGFTFIEVISPCPTNYSRRNHLGSALDNMKFFQDKCTIKHDADPKDVDITMDGDIVIGKFVDITKPTFSEVLANEFHRTVMGSVKGGKK